MLSNRPTRPWLGSNKQSLHRTQGASFRTFLPAFIEVPCQVVKGARQVRWRVQAWNPWLGPFFRLLDAL